jgi:hypothetical protein
MKTIYENNFVIIQKDEDLQLIRSSWKENTQDMEEEDIKGVISTFVDFIEEYKPNFILSNDSKRECVYTLEMQKWVADTIAKAAMRANVLKYALILPDELISLLSTEQTVDEVLDLSFELKYFENEESAKKWLHKP